MFQNPSEYKIVFKLLDYQLDVIWEPRAKIYIGKFLGDVCSEILEASSLQNLERVFTRTIHEEIEHTPNGGWQYPEVLSLMDVVPK